MSIIVINNKQRFSNRLDGTSLCRYSSIELIELYQYIIFLRNHKHIILL